MDPEDRAALEQKSNALVLVGMVLLLAGTAVVGCLTGSVGAAFSWPL